MSWENGDNLYDYVGSTFIRYTKDQSIFTKATALLQYYDSTKNYPFSINDLNSGIGSLIGVDLDTFSHYVIPGIENMQRPDGFIYWDRHDVMQVAWEFDQEKLDLTTKFSEELIDSFEKEITVFAKAVSRSPSLYWLYSSDPMKLQELEIYRPTDSNCALIKINRKDGASLTARVTDEDLAYLAETANSFRKEKSRNKRDDG